MVRMPQDLHSSTSEQPTCQRLKRPRLTCQSRARHDASCKSRMRVGPTHFRCIGENHPNPIGAAGGGGRSAPDGGAPPGLLRPASMDREGRQGWVPWMGFAFLSFNCGVAVYRSWDDPYAVAFVVTAYAALVLLFRCLHLVEGRRDQRLKLAVWGLCTLLTLMFSYKVAAILPPWAQLLVWVPGIITIVAGFYAFFVARLEEP